MPYFPRLAWLLLLLLAGAGAAFGQPASPPQRPFAQLIDVWTRQLDRVATRAEQANLLPVEIDTLREQVADVRAAASAAAAIARNDLADTKKLLAPLDAKPGSDAAPETDAVKADRARLSDLAAVSESQVKQCEVIIARADQLTERLTKLRGQVMLEALLHRDVSPLSPDVWRQLGPQFKTAVQTLSAALAGLAGAAVLDRERPRTVAGGAPSDGDRPHRRVRLRRPDAGRRRPQRTRLGGRPGDRRRRGAAHLAGAQQPRLARG